MTIKRNKERKKNNRKKARTEWNGFFSYCQFQTSICKYAKNIIRNVRLGLFFRSDSINMVWNWRDTIYWNAHNSYEFRFEYCMYVVSSYYRNFSHSLTLSQPRKNIVWIFAYFGYYLFISRCKCKKFFFLHSSWCDDGNKLLDLASEEKIKCKCSFFWSKEMWKIGFENNNNNNSKRIF